MLKIFVWVDAAARHEGVGDADGGRVSKLNADIEFIVILQKAIVNDMEDVVPIVQPILVGHLRGDMLQLVGKSVFAGHLIFPFQQSRNRVLMLRAQLPKERAAGIFPAARVGYVEHIFQPGPVARGVDKRDALAAAPDVPVHLFVPEIVPGASRRIRPLRVNHELLMIRVLVEPRGGGQKIRPALAAAGDLRRRVLGHLRVCLHLAWHVVIPSFLDSRYIKRATFRLLFVI
ncbi:MAG: hypothetical protein ABF904_04550 [Ethanoligenens sp.]